MTTSTWKFTEYYSRFTFVRVTSTNELSLDVGSEISPADAVGSQLGKRISSAG